MASPSEKLAVSLKVLQALQAKGVVAIRSKDLSRTDRERLMATGFIREVMKGWYISTRPDEAPGDSTSWYTSFWDFCASYLSARFGKRWCLSPEQSLSLHGGNRTVPTQLIVRTPMGGNKPVQLPHGTSLFDVRNTMPEEDELVEMNGLRLFSIPAALVNVSEEFFRRRATDVQAAMVLLKEASGILAPLLDGGHSTIAGRLAGAFRQIGQAPLADEIIRAMETAGYRVRESNPFQKTVGLALPLREASPYVSRIRLMWQAMRQPVIDHFPVAPRKLKDKRAYLRAVDELYVTDAYHSLSIEGYRVNAELIEKVRSGSWNPEMSPEDRENRNALAARGYYDAFVQVRESIRRVLGGANPGEVAASDHGEWYRRLFGASVTAGIIKASDLAGYRNAPVYIRRSMHVPFPREAVRDCMPVLFEQLGKESDPGVRLVLGHFVFVYIHPYLDGNGRIGRFIMNVMAASGGYPWTVIPVDRRKDYMQSLETASVKQEIRPFAKFIAELVKDGMRGKTARLPVL